MRAAYTSCTLPKQGRTPACCGHAADSRGATHCQLHCLLHCELLGLASNLMRALPQIAVWQGEGLG